MSEETAGIRITLALNPKQIADQILSGEVTSDSHFVSEEDHLHIASLLDTAHKEHQKLRAEVEKLRDVLGECACNCSRVDDCECGRLGVDGYCVHFYARKALEGAP